MEGSSKERRVLSRRRKPLSDCTNICSSSSSPSDSVPLKSHKTNASSSSSAPSKRSTVATINLDSAPNPTSPSTPSLNTPSIHETVDVEASEPISVVYTRRRSSNKRKKDKGKALAVPFTSTPNLKTSHTCNKDDEFEGVNLPKAKAMTVPRAKKQRVLSSEKDEFKDHQLQEFIEKQNAYFKEIDEFELEVESGDELD